MSSAPRKLQVGDLVWVFYRLQREIGDPAWCAVTHQTAGYNRPLIGYTDGWVKAVVSREFKRKNYDITQPEETGVKVVHEHKVWFDRECDILNVTDLTNLTQVYAPEDVMHREMKECPGSIVRNYPPPALSIFVLRWGNSHEISDCDYNSWGDVGSNVSDQYVWHVMEKGVRKKFGNDYEVITAFVEGTDDLAQISPLAIKNMMSGRHQAGMYFLWPTSFQDRISTIHGYVGAHEFFTFMSSIESFGIPSRFPHNCSTYRMIVSKDFYAHLCTIPSLRMPKTTKVSRAIISRDPHMAARFALDALVRLGVNPRNLRRDTDTPMTEAGGIIAKLGYSWEAMDVKACADEEMLANALEDLVEQKGCLVDSVLVQERVGVDLELRIFVCKRRPRKVIYTRFMWTDGNLLFREFVKTDDHEEAAKKWFGGDSRQLDRALEIAYEVIDQFNDWWWVESCVPSPANRFDFLVQCGEGHEDPKVYLGEVGELGFSMVSWKEGPGLVFPAVAELCGSDTMCKEEECVCKKMERRGKSMEERRSGQMD